MITPAFELSQEPDFLTLCIRVPYTRTSEFDLYIDGVDFKFYAKPYFLRLTLPGQIVEDGREKASFDINKGLFTLRVPKQTAGEHFEGLQMLTSLLAPKGSRSAKPLVEDLSTEACGGGAEGEEEEDEEEFDWQVEQEAFTEGSEEELRSRQTYGFGNQRSGVFARLQEELCDVIDVKNPEGTTAAERRRARLETEASAFCHDHYLADLFEDDEIQGLLKFRPWWSELRPDAAHDGDAAVSFADDDKEQLRKFSNRSYVLGRRHRRQAWLGLADLLLAYTYEVRATEGEHNVESAWTVRKLSGTLSWLETYDSLQEVLVSFGRRVLCYPLHRHFSLVTAAARDTAQILQSGKACVLKCLLDIHRVFRENDPAYILNDLYVTDYCVWIQRVKSRKVAALADSLRQISLGKEDLGLELEELETAAGLVEAEEEKKKKKGGGGSGGEESDSDGSSSSEESDDSEPEGQDCASRTEGGGEGGGGEGEGIAEANPPLAPDRGGSSQLIQELGESVEELWISQTQAQAQARHSCSSNTQTQPERGCSQASAAAQAATDTLLELHPRRNPLLIVQTDDDIDDDDYTT